MATNDIADEGTRVVTIRLILAGLPASNRLLLRAVLPMLSAICEQQAGNNMTAANLGICIGQSLMWPAHAEDVLKNEVPPFIAFVVEHANRLLGPLAGRQSQHDVALNVSSQGSDVDLSGCSTVVFGPSYCSLLVTTKTLCRLTVSANFASAATGAADVCSAANLVGTPPSYDENSALQYSRQNSMSSLSSNVSLEEEEDSELQDPRATKLPWQQQACLELLIAESTLESGDRLSTSQASSRNIVQSECARGTLSRKTASHQNELHTKSPVMGPRSARWDAACLRWQADKAVRPRSPIGAPMLSSRSCSPLGRHLSPSQDASTADQPPNTGEPLEFSSPHTRPVVSCALAGKFSSPEPTASIQRAIPVLHIGPQRLRTFMPASTDRADGMPSVSSAGRCDGHQDGVEDDEAVLATTFV